MAHRMKKTIITAALTGSVAPMGYDIPTTPEQIAEDAYACWKQGAAIVHLHMRDSTGAETADPAMFAKTIRLIRERRDCDVIIDCASSCGPGETDGMRLELFRQLDGVEMGSFSAGSFNLLPETLCVNSPEFLKALGSLYLQRGIKPEVHIFDTGMLAAARYFAACGSLAIPCHYQLCLGVPGGIEPTVGNLAYLVERLPRGSTWSAFGVGEAHMPMLYAAIALGGHVRVGMEDTTVFGVDEDGTTIRATNMMLVKRAADAVRMYGGRPATPAQAREMLGIPAFEGDAICNRLGIQTKQLAGWN